MCQANKNLSKEKKVEFKFEQVYKSLGTLISLFNEENKIFMFNISFLEKYISENFTT